MSFKFLYWRGFYAIYKLRIWLVKSPLSFHLYFEPQVYLMGSIVMALVSVLVRQSIFKYLRNRSLVFCMKLVHDKGTKVTEPDFWKKILGGR